MCVGMGVWVRGGRASLAGAELLGGMWPEAASPIVMNPTPAVSVAFTALNPGLHGLHKSPTAERRVGTRTTVSSQCTRAYCQSGNLTFLWGSHVGPGGTHRILFQVRAVSPCQVLSPGGSGPASAHHQPHPKLRSPKSAHGN